MNIQTISIIGGGEIGSAIHFLLSSKDYSVLIYDSKLEKTRADVDMEFGLKRSDIIFICVPSLFFSDALDQIEQHASSDAHIISVTKGFSNKKLIPDILAEKTDKPWGLLAGPMIAEEILSGAIALGMIATQSNELRDRVYEAFSATALSIGHMENVKDVALGSILKNVYTIIAAISTTLHETSEEWGKNAHGFIVSESIKEMKRIISHLGEGSDAFETVAGMGDYITTSTSIFSANYEAGAQIARGEKPRTCEGITALENLESLLDTMNFPLIEGLKNVLNKKSKPHDEFIRLTKKEL